MTVKRELSGVNRRRIRLKKVFIAPVLDTLNSLCPIAIV